MPIYMDRHDLSEAVTAEAVAKVHQEDLKIQHDEKIIKWCREYWNATHSYSSRGAYLNFEMNEDGDEELIKLCKKIMTA